jgi:DNA end-binding protein Ku
VVPASAIDIGWFDRPYHLGPDGDDAAYRALVAVLADGDRRGVAHWVMRKKRYHGALGARADRLTMVTLRAPDEVLPAAEVELPDRPAVTAAERKLAEQLVAALDSEFDPSAFHDEYSERVRELARAKAQGRSYAVEEPPMPSAPPSMLEALRESLGRVRKGRRRAG